jgi:hypothetical protein
MIRSNLLEDDVGSVLSRALSEVSGTLYVVNPSRESISELVTVLTDREDPPEVRLLADDALLKEVMDDFIVASKAAELVDAGHLDIKILDHAPNHSLIVTDDTTVSIVSGGDTVAGLATDEDEFVDDVAAYYADEWDRAEPYSLRTPPLARVRNTLESDIGPEAASDFGDVLASLQTARGDGEGLDEVTISLLVAARNGELLYDISKWGEDIGLASKATFSRTKTTLEDMGLIDTEKVPIDVGRPRLRLILGDERLEEASTDELASVAQSLLAS